MRDEEANWRAAIPQTGDAPLASLVPGAPGAGLLRSKGTAALEAARRAAGEASFREAILSLALEHRSGWVSVQAILDAFGPDAQAVLRTFLY